MEDIEILPDTWLDALPGPTSPIPDTWLDALPGPNLQQQPEPDLLCHEGLPPDNPYWILLREGFKRRGVSAGLANRLVLHLTQWADLHPKASSETIRSYTAVATLALAAHPRTPAEDRAALHAVAGAI